jgi:hypothetical protein
VGSGRRQGHPMTVGRIAGSRERLSRDAKSAAGGRGAGPFVQASRGLSRTGRLPSR